MRGEITSGWMSWICRTCLLYSSVIVLNSVRQDITLGYNKLRAQRKSRDSICECFHTKGGGGWFTHFFSGPVLLESIQVFNVSAKSSWSPSITPCCCTPGRSEGLKQISIKSRRASRIWTLMWFMVEWWARTGMSWGRLAATWREQGHGLHENILFLLQAQTAQRVVKSEQRFQQERLKARYKTQSANRGRWYDVGSKTGKPQSMQQNHIISFQSMRSSKYGA